MTATYHLPKDVQVVKDGADIFVDGPHRSWNGAGTKTLQFRLLDGDTSPISIHINYQ